jgi:hypothetical protein
LSVAPLNSETTQLHENPRDQSNTDQLRKPDVISHRRQSDDASLEDRQSLIVERDDDLKSVKRKKKVKLECPCGIVYDHRDTYDAHMALHYSVEDPFRCRLCDNRSDNAVDFYLHVHRYAHDLELTPADQPSTD